MIDAAVLSVSRAEVEEMVTHKKSGALVLRALQHQITRAVVVIVILTNIVNVLGPILVGQKAVELFGSDIIGIVTAALTALTILFSEIIPKSVGTHYAPLISRIAAPAILMVMYALYPLVLLLDRLTSFFRRGHRLIGTEQQIRSLVTIGRRAGHIENDEGQLIHRAFILNDKTAADVMTPLKDVVGVTESDTIRTAADIVFHETYSRYPVFGQSIHHPSGLVISQDILEALSEGKDQEPVASVMREALLVQASMKCDRLLLHFRDRQIHLGIVQDGRKTVGIVTLEDVLEELVGEIEDEHDAEHQAKKV